MTKKSGFTKQAFALLAGIALAGIGTAQAVPVPDPSITGKKQRQITAHKQQAVAAARRAQRAQAQAAPAANPTGASAFPATTTLK